MFREQIPTYSDDIFVKNVTNSYKKNLMEENQVGYPGINVACWNREHLISQDSITLAKGFRSRTPKKICPEEAMEQYRTQLSEHREFRLGLPIFDQFVKIKSLDECLEICEAKWIDSQICPCKIRFQKVK